MWGEGTILAKGKKYVPPYMVCGKVFPQVPVEGWVIYSDVHGLLYGPGNTLCLPIYYSKTLQIHWVSCGMAVIMNKGWGL